MRKMLLLAAALVLLTTACRAEVNILVDVVDDGSGEVTFELGVDDELLELVEGFGGSEDDLFAAVPEGIDVETRREGDMTFYYGSETFTDTDELLGSSDLLEGADASFQELTLEVADGGATLDALIEMPDVTEAAEGLGAGGLGGFENITDDVIMSSLIVDLPGDLVESNADEVLADGRLKWDIPLFGGTVDIMAVTEAGGGGFPWGLIFGILGAAAIIGLAVLWTQRRQGQAAAALDSAPAPDPAQPVFDDDTRLSEPAMDEPTEVEPEQTGRPIDSI